MQQDLQAIFRFTCAELPMQFWQGDLRSENTTQAVEDFPTRVETYVRSSDAAGYLPDLARVELALHRLGKRIGQTTVAPETYCLNPDMALIEVDWQPLLPLLDGKKVAPRRSKQRLLLWRHPRTGEICRDVAPAAGLLAMKVVAEQLDPLTVAAETGRPVGVIDAAIEQAVECGLLLAPVSSLRRDAAPGSIRTGTPEEFLRADVFTLQWHITHRCDLHCQHCYDRSLRDDVGLEQGQKILDQLRSFCLSRHVRGQVSFSGGNPLLHPEFPALYQAARDRNLNLAILGNPVSEERLDHILQIARPAFYQVSLEGLRDHNDQIRGPGSFDAVLDFLALLRSKESIRW